MKKETQNFEFYYYHQDGNGERIVNTKRCKIPRSTKIYKHLLNKLDEGLISSFGYQVIDSNVCSNCGHENPLNNFICEGIECGIPMDLIIDKDINGLPNIKTI